jgi:hypothetical protein
VVGLAVRIVEVVLHELTMKCGLVNSESLLVTVKIRQFSSFLEVCTLSRTRTCTNDRFPVVFQAFVGALETTSVNTASQILYSRL